MTANRWRAIPAGIVGFSVMSAAGQPGIVGSGHDFSGFGWSNGEICLPCHTPHFANSSVARLWNHQLTTANYILYDGAHLVDQPDQPGLASTLCLSCHDGTVALDSFGGLSGSTYIDGSGLIGTDLRDDHPIGIDWLHQDSGGSCGNCHNVHGPDPETVKFYDGKLECMSCHEPHNSFGHDAMARVTLSRSELCLTCHHR